MLTAEDARRQLEGRAEVVEDAVRSAAALESLLSSPRWKRHLRERPEILQSLLRQESALEEALARIHRRATAEHWPEALPVLAAVHQLEGVRTRLTALVHRRLAAVSRVPAPLPLREALTRLEERVLRPLPLALAPGEVRLMEGSAVDVFLVFRLYGSVILGLVVTRHVGNVGALLLLGLLAVNIAWALWRSGRYLLTTARLVWYPSWGEPVQVPLSSIIEGGVQRTPSGIRVVGERSLTLPTLQEVVRLATALELRRQPPLLGASADSPLEAMVCYPATFLARRGVQPVDGYVVLRPGSVVFLPGRGNGLAVLRAITGVTPSPSLARLEVPSLFDELRFLDSEAAFDACVERAVAATGGVRWAREDTRYDTQQPVWKNIHLWLDTPVWTSLSGKVEWNQQARAERILASWASR